MPHLQVAPPVSDAPDDPFKATADEAGAGDTEGDPVCGEANVLLALAATAPKPFSKQEVKIDQSISRSSEQDISPTSNEYGSHGHVPWPPVTPSPFHHRFEGYPPPAHSYEHPGWMGYSGPPPDGCMEDGRPGQLPVIYEGSRRLFVSPIRRANDSERVCSEPTQARKSEGTHSPSSYNTEPGRSLHYRPDLCHPPYFAVPNIMPPTYAYHYPPHPHGYDERYIHGRSVPMSPLKRTAVEGGSTQQSPKKKQLRNSKPDKGKVTKLVEENRRELSDSTDDGKGSKQRVISPTSSLEGHSKADEDEERNKPQAKETTGQFFPLGPPGAASFMRTPLSPHTYYPGTPRGPVHPGYHGPPRENWRMTPPRPFPPHGLAYGPSTYPARYGHPHGGIGYSYPPPGRYPPPQRQPPKPTSDSHGALYPRKDADVRLPTPSPQATAQSPLKNDFGASTKTIKSVSEWQQAALTTGMAPSANRCMALKAPIPSKYWGEAEKTKDVPVPDFHRLVNFPDYLTKARPVGIELNSSNGKRNCVMCGKLRLCSASTNNLGGNILRRGKNATSRDDEDSVSKATTGEGDETVHIIPRQNKGLCTGCDVTVWVVAENKLEIKWCKGCKNFRPWASFGDKGSATKCVRCRDRQREKYALQKDELREKRTRMSEEKNDDQEHEMAAAKGLRDLMAMGAESH